MFARPKQALILALILAVPALAQAADPKAADKVAEGMLNFQKFLTAGSTQIDTTLNAMNALSKPDANLMDAYKVFSKEVQNLGKMADKAKSNADKAASQRENYLEEWKKSQEAIQNPQLKAASEARRAELSPKIEALKAAMSSASTTFKPFHQDLKDLTVFLGNSLNTGTVGSAGEMFAKCNSDGASVKSDIEKANAALQDLANSIKPGGVPPAK